MTEFLNQLDIDYANLILTVLGAIATYVLVPIAKEIKEYFYCKKLDGYSLMLYDSTTKVVKELSETVVKEIKGTKEWTPERQSEILEICKTKIIQSISTEAYTFLKSANEDFELLLDSLIESTLYDIKHTK